MRRFYFILIYLVTLLVGACGEDDDSYSYQNNDDSDENEVVDYGSGDDESDTSGPD